MVSHSKQTSRWNLRQIGYSWINRYGLPIPYCQGRDSSEFGVLRMRSIHILGMIILSVGLSGCMPGAYVTKNPGKHDKGIRFYRPKPYLFVSPAGTTTVEGEATTIEPRNPPDEMVNIELKYMPDFSEEYSVRVIPGIGTATVGIKLEDGWNLTEITQDLDTKLPENIEAIANLTKAVTGQPEATSGRGTVPVVKMSVASRNVPLGFYEAVIGVDPCGAKQLYGWRYVGFMPFNGCPTVPSGLCAANCNDGSLMVYGLVFENQVMVFKSLGEVAMIPGSSASYREAASPNGGSEATGAVSRRRSIETSLQKVLDDASQLATIHVVSERDSKLVIKIIGTEEGAEFHAQSVFNDLKTQLELKAKEFGINSLELEGAFSNEGATSPPAISLPLSRASKGRTLLQAQ